ncbi:MAG: nucleoside triphosphate pyrophosphohydrolase [Heliobacteriaceae bacterium]|nr:nucleoside triphosphate pyrophosphohydrolase [Heliobacteriaceae bacterium]MDD4587649.1 nucleoside triphosphate pyrophosphohydrolase [Heliobacteriaceae bacterium]
MMPAITIVGLGAGDPGHLTMAGWEALGAARRLFLRTRVHPTVKLLEQQQWSFQSFDHLYEQAVSFDELYREIAGNILKEAAREPLTFAVPGHPFVGEKVVELVLDGAAQAGLAVKVIPGVSFLEAMYPVLGCDPAKGLLVLDALNLTTADLVTGHSTVIAQMYSPVVASEVKLTLMAAYPDEHPVVVVRAAGIRGEEQVARVPLYTIDRLAWVDHLTSLYIPPLVAGGRVKGGPVSDCYPLDPLVEVITKLLGPDGCPWDREQNHHSLKPYLLEEAYEVLEAIDSGDDRKLAEELGDVLLQVVFHSLLAAGRESFDVNDVVRTVTAKMVRRHPHVFAGVKVADTAEVLVNWEAIKNTETGKEQVPSVLGRVTAGLPALLRAEKVQGRAARVGFDWPDWHGPQAKVAEEWAELLEAVQTGDPARVREELGDLLFAVVNLARFLRVNPEEALYRTVDKFIRRFQYVEACCRQDERQLTDCSPAELDVYWEAAKAGEE